MAKNKILRSQHGTDYTRHFEIDTEALRSALRQHYKRGDQYRFTKETGVHNFILGRFLKGSYAGITRQTAFLFCQFYNLQLADFIRSKI